MPVPTAVPRRPLSPEFSTMADAAMKESSPILNFDDSSVIPPAESDQQMIFGPLDFEAEGIIHEHASPFIDSWTSLQEADMDVSSSNNAVHPPLFDFSGPSSANTNYGFANSLSSSFGSYGSAQYLPAPEKPSAANDNFYLSNWVNDQEPVQSSPTSPIPIPSGVSHTSSYTPFPDTSLFLHDVPPMSPTNYAAMQPLPASASPSVSSFDSPQPFPRQRVDSLESVSPHDTSSNPPTWATQLWDTNNGSAVRTPSSPRYAVRHSPLAERPRMQTRLDSAPTSSLFQSSSAPSPAYVHPPSMTRPYSRRAESASTGDEDSDATVRRKKTLSGPDKPENLEKSGDAAPQKSTLRVPKLAPSAWQLFFGAWVSRHQATSSRKLNVAQAAKEAGIEYANLSSEEKEPYKKKSQALKEAREREHNAYMRTLTPDDIKRENAFRSAQRKAGRSRKSNIKDPNAPKKPLSAYFMFLQRIRSDPQLVQDIFGDETETTKQSVLAAAKWRSMTDDERKPFLAQAEQEKMEYETARRIYEEGSPGYSQSINFSILPSSPGFQSMKIDSESESEGELARLKRSRS